MARKKTKKKRCATPPKGRRRRSAKCTPVTPNRRKPQKRKPTQTPPPQNTHTPATTLPDPGTGQTPDPGTPPPLTTTAPSSSSPGGGGGAPGGTTSPPPPGDPIVDSPIAKYAGPWGRAQAERLLWRAGFGPRPGQLDALVAMGLEKAVVSLTRVSGDAPLDGPEPTDWDGSPLEPARVFNHDHCYWQDRMARSRHSLVERMALIWHDWFATKVIVVQSQQLMLEQTQLFRTYGLGSFEELLWQVTTGGAMLLFLNGVENQAGAVNENYGREMMELFSLGPDRGAYTEHDVKEIARALSGWTADYDPQQGYVNFRFEASRHDDGPKTVFGQTGAWTPRDAVRMAVEHPLHASFLVRKLWSAFVPEPPPAAVASALEGAYVAGGRQLRPLVEAILCSPQLYEGPAMVKPPVVFLAGMFRALEKPMTSAQWDSVGQWMGQRLYEPPNVSGWNDAFWLDSSTMRARSDAVSEVLLGGFTIPYDDWATYPAQDAEAAVAAALAHWADPPLTPTTRAALVDWAARCLPAAPEGADFAQRQNALRHLVMACPDSQVC